MAILPTILLAITATSLSASLDIHYTPTNPIHFKDITSEAYLYTNILSHTFVEPYLLTENDLFEYIKRAFENYEQRCLFEEDSICDREQMYNETLFNTRTLLMNEAQSILFEMQHTLKRGHRTKRGFGRLIGELLHHFCDVATMDDVQQIALDNSHLGGRITQIQDLLIDTNFRNRRFEESTNRLKESLYTSFKMAFRSQQNLQDRAEIRALFRTQLMILIEHYNSIYERCFRQSLPSNAINAEILVTDLEEIEAAIGTYNLRLAIPISSVEDYYRLKMTQCSFMDDAILITLHIPLVSKSSDFKLLAPLYLPFKYFNQTCQVLSEEALIAVDSRTNSTHVITGQYLQMCNVRTHLCRVPFSHTANINSLCLQANYLNRPVDELRQLCPFSCFSIPVERPLINLIGDYTYVITNLPPNARLQHENGTSIPVSLKSSEIGALSVRIPCSSRLVLNDTSVSPSSIVTLIDKQLPCSEALSSSQHRLKRIIPYQWSSKNFSTSTDNITYLFDDLWQNITPSHSYLTDAEFTSKLKKIHDVWVPTKTYDDYIDILFDYLPYIITTVTTSLLYYRMRTVSNKLKRLETALLFSRVRNSD